MSVVVCIFQVQNKSAQLGKIKVNQCKSFTKKLNLPDEKKVAST